MGGGVSRREPEVHVVVVQSQENGKVDAKMLQQTYSSLSKGEGRRAKRANYDRSTRTFQQHSASSHTHVSTHNHTHSSLTTHGKKRPAHLEVGKEEGRLDDLDSNASSPQDKPVAKKPHENHMTSKRDKEKQSGTSLYQNHHFQASGLLHNTTLSSNSTATMETTVDERSKYLGATAVHRQSLVGEEFVSATSEKAGNMFELFRTHDGEEYTVYAREDGKKFYVDFEEQKWRYFPSSWNQRGEFVPIDYDPYQGDQNGYSVDKEKDKTNKREGEFIHPTRGKLSTFLKQETVNVLHFFDEASGVWLPMPLSWERHTPTVAPLIAEIQKACPEWKDARGIMAMLRVCNYSVEDCTSAYMAINDDGVLDYSDNGPGHNPFRSLTEKKLKETSCQLSEAKMKCKELTHRVEQLQARVEELEADNRNMRREIDSGKEEQRKKSKVLSRQLSQSFQFGRSGVQQLEVLRPLVLIAREETRTLKSKYTALRTGAEKGLNSYRTSLQQLSKVMSQLLFVHRRQSKEVTEVRALYRKEAMQRKLLFNEVQELRGNIRVFCRCRYDSSGPSGLEFDEDRVICTTSQGRKKVYEFERVYDPSTRQEQVFEDTKATITSCVDGYNVCIIAYGQTGAGKTYTMMGPRDNPGVNLRSMKELFRVCRERTKIKYTMKVSMMEVYNESVYDLLVSPDEGHEKLTIQSKGKNVSVPGVVEIEVRSMQDILMIFDEGEKNRTVASTKMNTNSSRSHLLFTLKLDGHDLVSKATTHGRLTLVDLAGSERISRSEATGIRLVEAAAINKSLSALGQVFISIRNGALHTPYRNSKLTHLLQPSIGGDSKACMFVNVSPLEANMAETISTLEFGVNTRQVELGKATKHVSKS